MWQWYTCDFAYASTELFSMLCETFGALWHLVWWIIIWWKILFCISLCRMTYLMKRWPGKLTELITLTRLGGVSLSWDLDARFDNALMFPFFIYLFFFETWMWGVPHKTFLFLPLSLLNAHFYMHINTCCLIQPFWVVILFFRIPRIPMGKSSTWCTVWRMQF